MEEEFKQPPVITQETIKRVVSDALHHEYARRGITRTALTFSIIQFLGWESDDNTQRKIDMWFQGKCAPVHPVICQLTHMLGNDFSHEVVSQLYPVTALPVKGRVS